MCDTNRPSCRQKCTGIGSVRPWTVIFRWYRTNGTACMLTKFLMTMTKRVRNPSVWVLIRREIKKERQFDEP